MSKQRTTIYLSEDQDRFVKGLLDGSRSTGAVPAFDSNSEVLRLLIDRGITALTENHMIEVGDEEVEAEVLLDLIPDRVLLDRIDKDLKNSKHHTIKGSRAAHTFSELADRMFEGPAKTKAYPEDVRDVSESFIEQVEQYHKAGKISEESVETQKEAIRERVETYREEYQSAWDAPSSTMREVPEEATIGAEVGRLKAQRGAFVEDLKELASTERFTNPDDLMKALAYDYGVSVETVSYLIDEITPDGTDGRQALKSGSGVDVPELVDEPQIDEPESEVEALPEGAVLRTRDADALSRIESHTDD